MFEKLKRVSVTVKRSPPVVQPIESVSLTLSPEDALKLRRCLQRHLSGEGVPRGTRNPLLEEICIELASYE